MSPMTSLPEDVALDILARVPRRDYPRLSLVSKHFRSLVSSPEIYARRSSLGCTEHSLYVVLRSRETDDYRLYILCRNANGKHSRLALIPWLPALPQHGGFVAVGSKIYVFGENNHKNDNNMTSTAYIIDCRSHTVQPLPSMPHVFQFEIIADIIDDKIYIIGYHRYDKKWSVVVVVFNTKTQIWEPGMINLDDPEGVFLNTYYGCVVLDNKIHGREFVYDPNENKWGTNDEMLNSKEWEHACIIDDVIYYYDGEFLAYDSKTKCWKAVEGLEEFLGGIRVKRISMTVSYGERLFFVFPIQERNGMGVEICCAEISLERRQGGQIFGKVEWFDLDLIYGEFEIVKPLDVML